MMNSQQTNSYHVTKSLAGKLVMAVCFVLLMGMMGAASIRVDAHTTDPASNLPPVAAVTAPVMNQPTAELNINRLIDAAQTVNQIQPGSHTILMEVTAYCRCQKCCGPSACGLTASGKHVSYNDGRFVAADTSVLPFGTKLIIPGYASDEAVEVIDRGGAIKGNKLDVYFDDHATALQWGRQMIEVTIIN
ncbi:MAG: 3D domain-containing protein [Phycisphaerales bacterium]|nr:3D domain-containing protein [Phycisphaerales bacterium]